MNKRTRTALLESIEKWRQIERGEMADMGSDNCSLCMEFIVDFCNGCPVAQSTQISGCANTPWTQWAIRFIWSQDFERVADTPELVLLARAERKFLESLLP